MKIFVMAPQSTKAAEKAKKPGDNALYVVLRSLKALGCKITGVEVALLPDGKHISFDRRAIAVAEHHKAELTLILGADTARNIKSWFPVNECVQAPQPFFYVNDPGRIKIELFEKLKEAYEEVEEAPVFGFDTDNNSIGGTI